MIRKLAFVISVAVIFGGLRAPSGLSDDSPPEPMPAKQGLPERSDAAGTARLSPKFKDLLPFGSRVRTIPPQNRAALNSGLAFLRSQQGTDGSWKAGNGEPNNRELDVGVTALAALAFLANGVLPDPASEPGATLARALDYLIKTQDAEGCLGRRSVSHFVYNHAFGSLALLEAFGATGEARYYSPTQRALDFIAILRNPYFGWRYGVKPGDNDTSVTGCMFAVLHAARVMNLAATEANLTPPFSIDDDAFDDVRGWVEKMTGSGRVGYQQKGAGSSYALPSRRQDSLESKNPLG